MRSQQRIITLKISALLNEYSRKIYIIVVIYSHKNDRNLPEKSKSYKFLVAWYSAFSAFPGS